MAEPDAPASKDSPVMPRPVMTVIPHRSGLCRAAAVVASALAAVALPAPLSAAEPATMPSTLPASQLATPATQAGDVTSLDNPFSVAATRPSTQPAEAEAETALLVDEEQAADGTLKVTVNESVVVRTSRPFARVAIGREDLAEIRPLGPSELLVTPRRPGRTQLVLWDDQRISQALQLESDADMREVQDKIDQLMPDSGIKVVDLGAGVALTGTVRDAETAARAEQIARQYGQVENMLDLPGGQQVSLRIRFAEVSRTAGKEFGVNFGFDDGGDSIAGSNIGQINPLSFFTNEDDIITGVNFPDPNTGVQLFGLGSLNGDPFAYYINALRESNLLRVLADPELVVTSGEQGEFLAGGEYPVPVPQEEGIAIDYRQFGIRLAYEPVVLGDGRIKMRLLSEVSDLDQTIGVNVGGVRVPGLRTRTTSTVVELRDGQTLAISGLIRSNAFASKSAVPLLGDVPILGALFRSTRYQRQETELVVLVTPRLVGALDPDVLPPTPGQNWKHPNDVELMLFGQLGGDAGVALPDDADRDGSDDRARGNDLELRTRYAFTPAEDISE